jgi:ABC-type iron transport system FetAB ATPase subunit
MKGFIARQVSNAHLKEIDLEISPRECVGITGPSGSGKSLLLRALADMDAFEGHLSLDGNPADSMPAPQWRRQVALLPATSAWWHDTVAPHFEDFETPAYESLGFPPEVVSWEIRRLSSGERQRLALLRVMALRPKVLLLDEPTANLDKANTRRAEALICDYGKRQVAAILWVSHDVDQLQRLCTRTYEMNTGRITLRFDGKEGV